MGKCAWTTEDLNANPQDIAALLVKDNFPAGVDLTIQRNNSLKSLIAEK